jgi:50S ribosomal subunit-associated GTPase HflX
LQKRGGDEDENTVFVSALHGTGIDDLAESIRRELRRGWLERAGSIPAAEGEILARLRACAEVVSETPDGEELRLELRIAPPEWERLRARYGARAPGLFGAPACEPDHDRT